VKRTYCETSHSAISQHYHTCYTTGVLPLYPMSNIIFQLCSFWEATGQNHKPPNDLLWACLTCSDYKSRRPCFGCAPLKHRILGESVRWVSIIHFMLTRKWTSKWLDFRNVLCITGTIFVNLLSLVFVSSEKFGGRPDAFSPCPEPITNTIMDCILED
jgi:hypothetical protein